MIWCYSRKSSRMTYMNAQKNRKIHIEPIIYYENMLRVYQFYTFKHIFFENAWNFHYNFCARVILVMIVRSHLNFPVNRVCFLLQCTIRENGVSRSKWIHPHEQSAWTHPNIVDCHILLYSKPNQTKPKHRWHNRHALEPILPLKWGGSCTLYACIPLRSPIYISLAANHLRIWICGETKRTRTTTKMLATVWPHFISSITRYISGSWEKTTSTFPVSGES